MSDRIRKIVAVVLVCVASLGHAPAGSLAASGAAIRIQCDNGIDAIVYPPEYLASRTSPDGTRGTIQLDGFYLSVITDISDPAIINKGDGRFHPFPIDAVIERLREIEYPRVQLGVEIYVLPYPRANVLVSSTSGTQVFLSPHVYEPTEQTMAYIVAHEIGHAFQNRYMPVSALDSWNEYRGIRGIEDTEIYHASASHANRPIEIFAEDFRVFFGGPLAFFEGRVENPNLPLPEDVPGLYGFFASLSIEGFALPVALDVESYPNPFNPSTELRVTLNEEAFLSGEPVSVRIYDVSGALVRELFSGPAESPEVRVQWDGRDTRGTPVASSTYFGVVQAGKAVASKKLSLLK